MPGKVPLGKPLNLTNAEIAELAEITEEDIKRVNELWQKYVPSVMKNLLLAIPQNGDG